MGITVMEMSKVGNGRLFARLSLNGGVWEYEFAVGAFTRESAVEKAARELVARGYMGLLTAATVRTAVGPRPENVQEEETKTKDGKRRMKAHAWLNLAQRISTLSLMVPETMFGIRIRGGVWPEDHNNHLAHDCAKVRRIMLENAPLTFEGGESSFLERWSLYVTNPKIVATTKVEWLFDNAPRGLNEPALVQRSATFEEDMRAEVMRRATRNIPGLIPVAPPPVIRGDRAASLINLIVPQIEQRLAQVPDAEERERLRSRLDKVVDRAEVAAANRSADRITQDVRLSIETLEEQVENAIPRSIEVTREGPEDDAPSGP